MKTGSKPGCYNKGRNMHLPQKCKTFPIGWFHGSGIMHFFKKCAPILEAARVPIPPQLVIGPHQYHLETHQEPAIFHVSHCQNPKFS